ncbi:MAG: hypothetical protein E7354_05220 [Clostridiales bacterium]|nr:hypothetical protein [Clostridiales bacterium]
MERKTQVIRKTTASKPEKEISQDLIVAVINRGFSDYVVSAARDAGATGATIMYGRGTADVDKQVMGISLQPEREIVIILVNSNEKRKIMQAIADRTSIMEEGRSLCFSLPVSSVYGLKRVSEQKLEQIKKAKELQKKAEQERKAKENK